MNELKIVRFVNFTDEDFVGTWNSVPQLIPAGTSVPMEDWRARHYAKHLINRYLVKNVPQGEKYTSPRKPGDIPVWQELLAKCIIDTNQVVAASNATMEIAKVVETSTPPVVSEGIKCDECDFVARNNVGVGAHKRAKHPKVNG